VGTLSFADVAEGVRATIAAYTQALDDGLTEAVLATYCADGSCDLPGMGCFSGHDELRGAYDRWKPRLPQRHLVLNTHVTTWGDDEATAVSDVVFLLMRESRWSVQLVGRYRDTLHRQDGAWLFHHRSAEFVSA
jgi:hypothetical protein